MAIYQRLLPQIAGTDILRANGGGQLRGLSLLVNEPPPGIGGPNGPLLTNLTAGSTPNPLVNTNFSDLALISQQQNNLSVVGVTPLSSGPPIPQFDPSISGFLNWLHQSTPQYSTVLTGGTNWLVSQDTNGNVGLTQGFSTGTQISLNFDNTRFTNNATRYTYNPTLSSSLGLTVTQPLLRGFGIDLNRRYIRIARNSQKVADFVFRQQVIDTIAGVTRLYTDLVSLNEDVNVKRETLALAERLYDDNKNKVDQGTLAPIEVTRAQAQVAANRQALISAEGLVRQQELIVLTALTRRGLANSVISDAHIVATDSVTVPQNESVEPLEKLVEDALKNRPDLAQAGKFTDQPERLPECPSPGDRSGRNGAEWRVCRRAESTRGCACRRAGPRRRLWIDARPDLPAKLSYLWRRLASDFAFAESCSAGRRRTRPIAVAASANPAATTGKPGSPRSCRCAGFAAAGSRRL